MDIREILHIKTGGHWLVTPSSDKTIFCREMFSEEHNDIKKMIFQFSEDRIFPNVQNIEKLDEDLCRSIMREMGELGLIGIDTPEEFGGTDLDKITAFLESRQVLVVLGSYFLEHLSKRRSIYLNS